MMLFASNVEAAALPPRTRHEAGPKPNQRWGHEQGTVFVISDPNNSFPYSGLSVGASFVMMVESSKIEWTSLRGRDAVAAPTVRLLNALQRNSLSDDGCQIDTVNTALTINGVAPGRDVPPGRGLCGISREAQSALSKIAGELKWQV